MTSARLDILLGEVALAVSLRHREMETYAPWLASANARPRPRLQLVALEARMELPPLDRVATG